MDTRRTLSAAMVGAVLATLALVGPALANNGKNPPDTITPSELTRPWYVNLTGKVQFYEASPGVWEGITRSDVVFDRHCTRPAGTVFFTGGKLVGGTIYGRHQVLNPATCAPVTSYSLRANFTAVQKIGHNFSYRLGRYNIDVGNAAWRRLSPRPRVMRCGRNSLDGIHQPQLPEVLHPQLARRETVQPPRLLVPARARRRLAP